MSFRPSFYGVMKQQAHMVALYEKMGFELQNRRVSFGSDTYEHRGQNIFCFITSSAMSSVKNSLLYFFVKK
jgi:hypothetical protein